MLLFLLLHSLAPFSSQQLTLHLLLVSPGVICYLNRILLCHSFICLYITCLPTRTFPFAPEAEVDDARTNTHVLEFDVRQPVRQRRVDVEQFVGSIGTQPKYGAYHMEDAAGGPRLGNVGSTRVENGKIDSALALHSRKHFWRSIRVKALDGVKDAANDFICFVCQSVALESI